MKTNIKEKLRNALLVGSAAIGAFAPSVALANDSEEILKTQTDLSAGIDEGERAHKSFFDGPVSVLQRVYSDRDGTQSQSILQNGFCKLAYRNGSDSRIYGIDLHLDKFDSSLDGFKLNIGVEDVKSSELSDSRALLQKSYDSKFVDFWNVEVQDNDANGLNDRVAGALGVNLTDSLKVQGTSDNEGNFGYALFHPVGSVNLGLGSHRVDGVDSFNLGFDTKLSDTYKLVGHVKHSGNPQGRDGLEVRLRLGDNAPGGAFLAGVQDTLFNSVTPFLAGDGDATFPFGIGDISFFDAETYTSGAAGVFGADVKFVNNTLERSLKTDVALGLGSVSDSYLRNNVISAGRTTNLDYRDTNTDTTNFEYRTTLLKSEGLSLDLGVRYEKPDEDKSRTSAALSLSYDF